MKAEFRHRSSVVEQLLCTQSVVRSNRDRWHQFRRCGGSALPETESMSPEQSWLNRRLMSAPVFKAAQAQPESDPAVTLDCAGADTLLMMRRTTLAQRGGYRHGKRRGGNDLLSRPSHIEGRLAMLERTVDRLLRLVGSLVTIESERVDGEIAEIGAAIKRYDERKAASSVSNGDG